MSDGGYKIYDQNAIYFITFAVIGWIDVFSRHIYSNIVVDSLIHCQKKKGLSLYSWIIMSNHIHLIASARQGFKLSDILRDFKKYTSTQILASIKENSQESRREWMLELFEKAGTKNSRNEKYQFWRQDNHPILLDSNYLIDQKLEYIHENPVKAMIVEKTEDYIFSSARDYAGIPGLIKIIKLK